MASFLSVFFHDQYHLTRIQAGDFATVVVLAGSFLRPVGGWVADKIGGYRLLLSLFAGIALCLMMVGSLPPFDVVVPVLFLSMGMRGNGQRSNLPNCTATFSGRHRTDYRHRGRRRRTRWLLSSIRPRYAQGYFRKLWNRHVELRHSYRVSAFVLLEFGVQWKSTWTPAAVRRTMVFCYRGFQKTRENAAAPGRLQQQRSGS